MKTVSFSSTITLESEKRKVQSPVAAAGVWSDAKIVDDWRPPRPQQPLGLTAFSNLKFSEY